MAEILRLGGEDKKVWAREGIQGQACTMPENASAHGCDWPVALEMPIPFDMQSVYCEVRFRVSERGGKYVQRNLRQAEDTCFSLCDPPRLEGTQAYCCNFQPTPTTLTITGEAKVLLLFMGQGGNQGHVADHCRYSPLV
ncbi:hypothetical protein N8703_03450 [Verrucomicrobia bacterium]|nr:hypothetical protein [Verrucomicrobiota bacterium]